MAKTRIRHYNGLVNLIKLRYTSNANLAFKDSIARSDVLTKYKQVRRMYPKTTRWVKGKYIWIYNDRLLEYIFSEDYELFSIGYELLKSGGVIDVQEEV